MSDRTTEPGLVVFRVAKRGAGYVVTVYRNDEKGRRAAVPGAPNGARIGLTPEAAAERLRALAAEWRGEGGILLESADGGAEALRALFSREFSRPLTPPL